MKWPALVLTLGTLIFFVSIAPQTASAQTRGGYGMGFHPSPYNGYPSYGPQVGILPASYGYGWNSYGGGYGYGGYAPLQRRYIERYVERTKPNGTRIRRHVIRY